MTEDKIDDKIRKLVRLAEKAGTEAEMQTAMAQAQALAARYHRDMQAVLEADRDPLVFRDSEIELWKGRATPWKWELAHQVAKAHGCCPWTANLAEFVVRGPKCIMGPSYKWEEVAGLLTEQEARRKVGFIADPTSPTFDRSFAISISEGEDEQSVRALWMFKSGPDAESLDLRLQQCSPRVTVVKVSVRKVLVMVGRKEPAQTALYIYRVMLDAVDRIARNLTRGRGKAALNSARWGLVVGLGSRLSPDDESDVELVFEDEAPKTAALVLTEAREESKRYLEDAFGQSPYRSSSKGPTISDNRAFLAGVDAASELDIPDPNSGRSSLGGGGRKLGMGRDRQLG